MNDVPADLKQPLCELLLAVADDKLILGTRNSDWTGLAPVLEEDIAFSALAQDDIAHASALYEMVSELTGDDPNRLAFGRRPDEYRCAAIVVLDDEFDWSVALVRQFFCDHFEQLRLGRLTRSAYAPLAALAKRLLAEERLAIGHADQWIVRLARGTEESRARIAAALERVAPLTATLFEPTTGQDALEAAGVYPPDDVEMHASWAETVCNVLGEAGQSITLPAPDPQAVGGRRGAHPPAFEELLAHMTEVYRQEPAAQW